MSDTDDRPGDQQADPPDAMPADRQAGPPDAMPADRQAGPPDAMPAISAAAEGLLMPSESDYPFEPFRWPGPGPLTPDALLAHLDLPPDTPVEERPFEAFFERLAAPRDWHGEAEQATAAHFARLGEAIAAHLTDPRVYRVGSIQIAVFIVGEDPAGATVGLRTMVIET